MNPAKLLTVSILLSASAFAQQPENLGKAVNSTYNEICPVIAPDGKTLYFVREQHPQNTKGGDDIWFSEVVSGQFTEARRMPATVNREEFNTVYSITPDGNTMLVKGAYVNGNYETRGFSICKKEGNGWGMPKKLEIPNYEKLSKGLYDCGFLSNDGKVLIMSFSEKKNGVVDDLYISQMDKNGKWSEPMNLGEEINTSDATETTPFLAADGVSLYFSSNRKGGLGNNDIYVAKRLDKSWKRWSKPVNLGAPINSEGFDAYYSVSAAGDYAYLVTRKEGEGKGDIVRIKLKQEEPITTAPTIAIAEPQPTTTQPTTPPKPIEKPVETKKTSAPVVLLSGKLFDSKTKKVPVNAKIIYEDLATGTEEGIATPDPITGEYKIVLPYGKKYGITALIDGYAPKSQNIDLTNLGKYLEITGRDIEVLPAEKGAVVQLNNIFFEYAKATLQAESYPELNRLVEMLTKSPKMTLEIAGHTDDKGTDENNLKLSQERAESVRNYLLSKGVAPARLQAKGYGESKPMVANDTDENRQKNRRVEFMILGK
ncbi:MAG: OmpA family protein [Spirosomataceae bacterium]